MKLSGLIAASALVLAPPAWAQQAEPTAHTAAPDPAIPDPVVATTRHSGNFGGQRIAYRAVAGETYLRDKDGKPLAAITSYSYIKDGPVDPDRPVSFIWNGGPGSG